ncbi:MAG TPA: PA14 domain-containing protein [Candidatus Acidoferrum sp.]|nr:PA14 domain-containing protein [Candidatus Acidoferrum sp.]
MRKLQFFSAILAGVFAVAAVVRLHAEPEYKSVKIGNYFVASPYGIAVIVDDATAFLINPASDSFGKSKWFESDPAYATPGTTAPDFSFSRASFPYKGAKIRFTWGRVGQGGVVGKIEADRKVAYVVRFPGNTWPHFHAVYEAAKDGLTGYGVEPRGASFASFTFQSRPAPVFVRADGGANAEAVFDLDPAAPARFVAGVHELPSLDSVDATLDAAGNRYAATRISAEGDWGDFLGAIADNLNNTRLYGSDNRRIVHGIGRGWWMTKDPDLFPYFVWDYHFMGMLSSLEDPEDGRDTVRGMLSFQTPDGRVPSFAHWGVEYDTLYRSMPPDASMCIWKMHERHPDTAFLAEAYPHLVKWHEWWMKARDGNHNGLLEWGSEQQEWQGAQYETGWDDNVAYIGTRMDGSTMNADAVDLSSLWSMDAEYLARIANALGKADDAKRFQTEHAEMNQRINDRLWNENLGIYCSRFWEVPASEGPELNAVTTFKNGFDVRFYDDDAQEHEVAQRHEYRLDDSWGEASPAEGVPAMDWSARVTTVFTAPEAGTYRFKIGGSDHVRMSFAGQAVEKWIVDDKEQRNADVKVDANKPYPVAVDYVRNEHGPASLHLTVVKLGPGKPGSDWLTRLTPMNFYPLIAGAADTTRAEKTLAWMYREDKFWLPALLPTVTKDDPVWPEQSYWHGHVWAPANYLVWLGVKRYADGAHQAEFARRSVKLFMQNWNEKRLDCENYNSTDGTCGDEPHYCWGALLDLIGLEALADVGADFRPVPRTDHAITEHIVARNVPFGGKLYRLEARDGNVTATEETPH